MFVIDTCSLTAIKKTINPSKRKFVFDELEKLCIDGRLCYPPAVLDELSRGITDGRSDLPHKWAKDMKKTGCRFGSFEAELDEVMNDPVASLTSDPNQANESEDADPFVLATALHLKRLGHSPTVVTQESNKKIPLVALNTASGALEIPAINLYAFLVKLGIWSDDMKIPQSKS